MKVEKTLHSLAVLWNRNFPSQVEGMITHHAKLTQLLIFTNKTPLPPSSLFLSFSPLPAARQQTWSASLTLAWPNATFCCINFLPGWWVHSVQQGKPPQSQRTGTLSWEKWKKKTGRMQWPLGSDCDTVTFYLEKLSWVANDLLQHQSSRGRGWACSFGGLSLLLCSVMLFHWWWW